MLRLMDANLDRLSEGLRVLEDVARFVLDDIHTTEKLKRMRHELTATDPVFQNRLLSARDSGGDVGREGGGITGTPRNHIIDLVAANAKRAQESLRVLEEFAKLPEMPAEVAERNFEHARFTLYEIEKLLTFRLARHEQREKVAGLYVIIDSQTLVGRDEIEITRQVIQGGASVVQLRDKHRDKRDLIAVADELKKICAGAGVPFLINDHVDVAVAIDADGVHVGQNDLPVSLAREMLALDKIIGCSARTVDLALRAEQDGADYIGVGAMYFSSTKTDAEVVGPGGLSEIKNAVSVPIVAIGGISEENISQVIEAGADSVAVIGAVLNSGDIMEATNKMAAKVAERGGK
jgi:thiamine-phosphate pyrophosphorylase